MDIKSLVANHKIWSNPLLKMFANGQMKPSHHKLFFGQYACYSNNFTNLLLLALQKCQAPQERHVIVQNLWEEMGGEQVSQTHQTLFANFLSAIGVERKTIISFPETEQFVLGYIKLCTDGSRHEIISILTYATEGIVSRLYRVFLNGLRTCHLTEKEVLFFTEHIDCDEHHYQALESILGYSQLSNVEKDQCIQAVIQALDLRDAFFEAIYKRILLSDIEPLIDHIVEKDLPVDSQAQVGSLEKLANSLYENVNTDNGTNFHVDRINFSASVLDPRILTIPPKGKNEYHRHAHESMFYVIAGSGKVRVSDQQYDVAQGDFVFVPRWLPHQTINNSDEPLVILAVTDYHLTRHFPGNSEKSYREAPQSVLQ